MTDRILVTNDDGFQSHGIAILRDAAEELGATTVVAPAENRSAASSALTVSAPLKVAQISDETYAVSGTPCDCVHLTISHAFGFVAGKVVSGINHGPNMGDDALHSGTLAAAIEGRFVNHTSLAFSLASFEIKHMGEMKPVVLKVMRWAWAQSFPAGTILNVNIPDLPPAGIRGYKMTRLGQRGIFEPAESQQDPRGRDWYWLGAAGRPSIAGEGTDFYWVEKGYVSITPIQIDMTDYRLLEAYQSNGIE